MTNGAINRGIVVFRIEIMTPPITEGTKIRYGHQMLPSMHFLDLSPCDKGGKGPVAKEAEVPMMTG